jgi:hypothetical protein
VFLILMFVSVPLSVAVAAGAVAFLGFPEKWGMGLIFLGQILFVGVLVNLLRRGYFPWLLR